MITSVLTLIVKAVTSAALSAIRRLSAAVDGLIKAVRNTFLPFITGFTLANLFAGGLSDLAYFGGASSESLIRLHNATRRIMATFAALIVTAIEPLIPLIEQLADILDNFFANAPEWQKRLAGWALLLLPILAYSSTLRAVLMGLVKAIGLFVRAIPFVLGVLARIVPWLGIIIGLVALLDVVLHAAKERFGSWGKAFKSLWYGIVEGFIESINLMIYLLNKMIEDMNTFSSLGGLVPNHPLPLIPELDKNKLLPQWYNEGWNRENKSPITIPNVSPVTPAATNTINQPPQITITVNGDVTADNFEQKVTTLLAEALNDPYFKSSVGNT